MKKNKKKFNIFPLLIVLATIFMSVGYATVNSVILDINGSSVAIIADKIFISYATASGSGVVSGYYDTMLTSSVALSSTDKNSTETIQVNIFNNSGKTLFFSGTSYNSEIPGGYTNSNIDFTLSGINIGEELSQGEDITFNVTFKYTDSYKAGSAPYNGNLSSIINFDFVETMEGMVTVSYSGITSTGHPTMASTGSSLIIDFGSTETAIIGITMGGVGYTGYTFTGNVLTIPEVTDNIVITGVEKTEDVEYLITTDAPIVEEFTGETAITSLTDLVANAHVHAYNGTAQNITEITLIHTYVVGGGNNKVIQATLMVDDQQVGNPLTITYQKKAKTDTDVSVTFTNLNISPSSKIYITFDISNANNGNVTLKKQTVNIKFG